jgi:hypothetical protein
MAVNKAILIGILACGVVISSDGRSSAGLIYDDGPPDTSGAGTPIFNFDGAYYSASNSFTVGGPTTLTSAQVALNVSITPDPPTTLDWSIGTTPFASDVASGSAVLTSSFLLLNLDETYWESTFAITGAVSAGTYWLTLANSSVDDLYGVEWTNNPLGSSTAAVQTSVPLALPPIDVINPTIPSSFQIYGTTSATPEPTSLSLLGTGFLAAGATRFKRRRNKPAESA